MESKPEGSARSEAKQENPHWKEKALEAHRAKVEAEQKQKEKQAHGMSVWADNALAGKLSALGIPPGGIEREPGIETYRDIKFKVIRDRAKPAEDVESWELYMGVEREYHSGGTWMPWYGPIASVEDVGSVLAGAADVAWDGGEPRDYGSAAPAPEPPKDAGDRIEDFIRGLPSREEMENAGEVVGLRILTEIAIQLERLAGYMERFDRVGITTHNTNA